MSLREYILLNTSIRVLGILQSEQVGGIPTSGGAETIVERSRFAIITYSYDFPPTFRSLERDFSEWYGPLAKRGFYA